MDTPTTRVFQPVRIIALVLITVLLSGLVYMGSTSGDDPVSVPAGGQAGDLTLEACSYETEDGPYEADCGTLVVPENRADPQSRLIALEVVRIRSRSGDRAEPVFWFEGGPGESNLEFAQASRLAEGRDVVMVGYRGIDGSVRLDCPEVGAALTRSADLLAEGFFDAYADAFGRCADRLTDQGVDLAHYGLVQQVDDMEAARAAFGYDRIDLLSQSAGTRAAMIYAWRHPDSIHRSVMIAVNPPGNYLWDPDTSDEQIGRFAALCDEDAACRARTDDLAATIRRTAADLPDRWGPLPIEGGYVRTLSLYGLMGPSSTFPPGREVTLEGWLAAAEGDMSGLWLVSTAGDLFLPQMFVWGEYAAAARADAAAAREYYTSTPRDYGNLGYAATTLAWGEGRWLDAWPAAVEEDAYRQVRTSQVPTLLVGGELDVATPPQVATTQLLPSLPNGHEVVLPGFGHSPTFWAYQAEAGTRLITAFLDRGEVDDSLYRPQPLDFTLSTTLGRMAKIGLGVMVLLAVLTVGSLAWMARRVRRRDRFGRAASVALRSVYPIVLGLGGWFLAVLTVQIGRMNVPLDSEPLVVIAVGVPIGLGVSLAWTDRDRSAATTRTGFVSGVGGALLGAWLGFNAATVGFVGLIFAIAGAIAAANLLLIIADITAARTGPRPTPPEADKLARQHAHA